jgi:hypothetical protein
VLGQLGGPLFLLLAVLVVVEAASATAKRRLLRGALGADAPIPALTALLVGLGRPLARPLSTLGTAALGWLTSAIVLLPALWAVGLAWQAVRAALLDPQRLAAGGADTGLAALAVLALCAAWLAALALAGVSSAIRAGLWSAEEARGRP